MTTIHKNIGAPGEGFELSAQTPAELKGKQEKEKAAKRAAALAKKRENATAEQTAREHMAASQTSFAFEEITPESIAEMNAFLDEKIKSFGTHTDDKEEAEDVKLVKKMVKKPALKDVVGESVLDESKKVLQTAHDWHGGQYSPLYSFASTGGKVHDENHRADLSHEIRTNMSDLTSRGKGNTSKDMKELSALHKHVLKAKVEHPFHSNESVMESTKNTPREITNSHQGVKVKIHNPGNKFHGLKGILTGAGTKGASEVKFDNAPTSMHGHENIKLHNESVMESFNINELSFVQTSPITSSLAESIAMVMEAKKKVGEYSEGNHTARVYKLSGEHDEGDPYKVQLHKNGKHHEPSDYFTNDLDDAHGTAKSMVKHAASVAA